MRLIAQKEVKIIRKSRVSSAALRRYYKLEEKHRRLRSFGAERSSFAKEKLSLLTFSRAAPNFKAVVINRVFPRLMFSSSQTLFSSLFSILAQLNRLDCPQMSFVLQSFSSEFSCNLSVFLCSKLCVETREQKIKNVSCLIKKIFFYFAKQIGSRTNATPFYCNFSLSVKHSSKNI